MFDKDKMEKGLIDHGMHPSCIDLDVERERFIGVMTAGLEKQGGGSLLMLPTYIGSEGELPKNDAAIVIDAGGSNLRVALVRFDENSNPDIEYFEKYPMPGSLGPITKDEMFDHIASYVELIADKSDKIGFCFSYVFESTPQRDGKIQALCKEVIVSGIEGAYLCEELEAALIRRGQGGTRRYVTLNDTVATLLGAKAVHGNEGCDSYVGFILGTGQNACYVERTGKIKKLPPNHGYDAGSMIVNMESGIYTGFKQGTADKTLDSKSQYPGDHMFEKMTSGGYFGDMLYETLLLLCGDGLFSDGFHKAISGIKSVDLRELTDYIMHKSSDNFYSKLAAQNEDDGKAFDLMVDLLYERAAKMIVTMFCAIAEQADFGARKYSPLRICAEGTTYYRSPLLLKHLNHLLESYAVGERGRHIEIVKTNNATLIGTALAALIN